MSTGSVLQSRFKAKQALNYSALFYQVGQKSTDYSSSSVQSMQSISINSHYRVVSVLISLAHYPLQFASLALLCTVLSPIVRHHCAVKIHCKYSTNAVKYSTNTVPIEWKAATSLCSAGVQWMEWGLRWAALWRSCGG